MLVLQCEGLHHRQVRLPFMIGRYEMQPDRGLDLRTLQSDQPTISPLNLDFQTAHQLISPLTHKATSVEAPQAADPPRQSHP